MDTEDTASAGGTQSVPASPASLSPRIHFPETPEHLGSPRFQTPSSPPTPADEHTPIERRGADPLTPTAQFDVNIESPDYLPPTKRTRQALSKVPKSFKRQLLMPECSNASRQSSGTPPQTPLPDETRSSAGQAVQQSDGSSISSQSLEATLSVTSPNGVSSPLPQEMQGPGDEDSNSDSDVDSDTNFEVLSSDRELSSDPGCDIDGDLSSHDSEDFSGNESESSEEGAPSDVGNDEEDLLYPGSNVSVAEAIVKIMDLFVKHHLSKEALKDTLKAFDALLPDSHVLPTSMYGLFKHVENFSSVPSAETYFYCEEKNCFKPKDDSEQECFSCGGTATGRFFYFPLADQIKFLFEKKNLAHAVDLFASNQSTDSRVICDTSCGEEYKKIRSKLTGQYDLVLQWNVDGVAVTKSSPITMWYLLCFPCEVPPELRPSYTFLVGVWCAVKKPPMNMFLEPFSKSLKDIVQTGGVEWTHQSTGNRVKSLVVAPILVADAPAKADALVIQYFGAKYGCHVCEQKRALVKIESKQSSRNVRSFVFQETAAPLRTAERMDKQGSKAEQKEKPVKGVKGRAVVSEIPFFDRACSVPAEYMHAVLLGVVKYFTLLWLETNGPWCIRKSVDQIDLFLKTIHVPYFIHRPTTGGLKVKFWKASEWRSWLLFYSLPALQGVLPDQYFQHWILLVNAIFILVSEKISVVELENAEIMLRMFVRDIKFLYGEKFYTYNVHQLLHLCVSVKRWGPLKDTSAFIFESFNGLLGSLMHGTKHKAQELVNQVKLVQGVIAMKNFTERSKRRSVSTSVCSCRGKPVSISLSSEQQAALLSANIVNCPFYRRAENEGVMYSSVLYDQRKRQMNSYVKFSTQDHPVGYAQIVCFVKKSDNVYALLKTLQIDHLKTIFHEKTRLAVKHIVPVTEETTSIVIPVNQLSCVLLKVGSYLISPPNLTECNL